MITYKEIEEKTMTPAKREEASDDWFSFYVGRKLTYLMTIPLLYTPITPNVVTWFSILCLLASFVVLCFSSSLSLIILGWCLFFLWSLLDGVDGNIARYKQQFSKTGDLCDTMGGYLAIALVYLGFGVVAFRMTGPLDILIAETKYIYIVLGGLSSIFGIFPRLIMHKALSSGVLQDRSSVKGVKKKKSILRLLVGNLSSITGGVMVISLACCLFGCLDLFTVSYCCINFMKMIAALFIIFKRVKNGG